MLEGIAARRVYAPLVDRRHREIRNQVYSFLLKFPLDVSEEIRSGKCFIDRRGEHGRDRNLTRRYLVIKPVRQPESRLADRHGQHGPGAKTDDERSGLKTRDRILESRRRVDRKEVMREVGKSRDLRRLEPWTYGHDQIVVGQRPVDSITGDPDVSLPGID